MDIMNYVVQEIVVVSVVLNVLGVFLKKAEFIKDKFIPLILLPFGIAGAFGILEILNKADFTTAIMQGILATGLAVFANQFVKQTFSKE